MFTQAGQIKVKITDIMFADPKFAKGENDFDICIKIEAVDDPSQSDWWRGEMSQNYGRGTMSNMTQAQITMRTLHSIGFEGDDLSTLNEQVNGKRVPAMIKETTKDGKTFYNISYIGGGRGNAPSEDKVLSKDAIKNRMKALMAEEPSDAQEPEQGAAKPKASAPAAGAAFDPFA